MKNPTMIYKAPGPHEIHGGHFDYRIVDADEEGELEQAMDEGWHLTTTAAKKAADGEDDAPPTRNELVAKAKDMGLSFGPNTSSKKLGEMIAATLALQPNEAIFLQQTNQNAE